MSTHPDELRALIERALAEDAPAGDLTAELVVAGDATCRAELRAKANGVLAGVAAAQAAFGLFQLPEAAQRFLLIASADDTAPSSRPPGALKRATTAPPNSLRRWAWCKAW